MGLLERLGSRLLTWSGLDFDFELDDEPLHRITPHLHLGRRPRPDDVAPLRRRGITDVVSCLPESERESMAFLSTHFRARFVPIRDGMHHDVTPLFEAFFASVTDACDRDGELLVHCQVGVSRSASLAIAYLMHTEHLRFLEAFETVRTRRAQVLPNIGFASQLQRFEHTRLGPRPRGELASLTHYLHRFCNVPTDPEVLQQALVERDFDAVAAIRSIFGGQIPRVVQGVRL